MKRYLGLFIAIWLLSSLIAHANLSNFNSSLDPSSPECTQEVLPPGADKIKEMGKLNPVLNDLIADKLEADFIAHRENGYIRMKTRDGIVFFHPEKDGAPFQLVPKIKRLKRLEKIEKYRFKLTSHLEGNTDAQWELIIDPIGPKNPKGPTYHIENFKLLERL